MLKFNTIVCAYEAHDEFLDNFKPYAFDEINWIDNINARKAVELLLMDSHPIKCFVTERLVVWPCDFVSYESFRNFCLRIVRKRMSDGCIYARYDSIS